MMIKGLFVAGMLAALGASGFGGEAQTDFGDAKWVWPKALGKAKNTTVQFRKTFAAKGGAEATMDIAADTVYAVRFNGRDVVLTSRFPDVPPWRTYERVSLGALRDGDNELIISLYVQGVDSFQHLPGDPGLMFAVHGAGEPVTSGAGLEWRVDTRWQREGVPLVTSQLGFSFAYDALAKAGTWQQAGAADATRGVPQFDLHRRPVPRVDVLPEVAEKIVAQGRLDGSSVPALAHVASDMDKTKMTPVPEADFFVEDGRKVRPEFFEDGFYVIADLGREEAGLLSLEVDTDPGVTIDVGHAEHWEHGRIRTFISGRNFAGRYRTPGGRASFCRWARRMAGRYVQIHVRGVKTHFTLGRLSLKPVLFPVVEKPVPENLTARQKEIWKTSVRTLRLCMHEHYEDCPWREQALYGNDGRNQMLCGYFAFDESNRMPEFALEVHARGLDAANWLEMCMPAKIRITIPSFTFCWVLSVGDNLKYRKDVAFVRKMLPTMRKILNARLGELSGGLLPCPAGKRYWQFYEWSKGMDGSLSGANAVKPGELRFESPLNLFFVLALESGATCAAATGDDATATRWRAAAAALRGEIRRRFWNAARGEFDFSLDAKVAPSEFVQSLAVLADVVPAGALKALAAKLSGASDWTEITLSQAIYKYEALLAAGCPAEKVVAHADAEWSKMLDAGATSFWEMREGWPAFSNAGSLCHGWSAIPIYIYSRINGQAK